MELVVAGSYDGGLVGYKLTHEVIDVEDGTKSKEPRLEPVFAYTPHIGCVKAVACCGSVLATGGTDESVRLYNAKKMIEVGTLQKHSGSITCLDLFGKSHLISGADDSSLLLWRCSDWELLQTFKGHKKAIVSVQIHPTGRLALSASQDLTLRLWDMMRGTCAVFHKLQQVPVCLQWSPSGASYAVCYQSRVTVYDAATSQSKSFPVEGADARTVQQPAFVACSCFITERILLLGMTNGKILMYHVPLVTTAQAPTLVGKLCGHDCRVKGMSIINAGRRVMEVVSGSTDGRLCVWRVDVSAYMAEDVAVKVEDGEDAPQAPKTQEVKEIEPISEIETGIRLTVLTCSFDRRQVANACKPVAVKKEEDVSADAEAESSRPKAKKVKTEALPVNKAAVNPKKDEDDDFEVVPKVQKVEAKEEGGAEEDDAEFIRELVGSNARKAELRMKKSDKKKRKLLELKAQSQPARGSKRALSVPPMKKAKIAKRA